MEETNESAVHTLKVRAGAFEGPLSLLLELIEARKLFINEIALAEVTDEFIGRLREKSTLPLGETTHFVAIASTLLLIKSRSLLPNLTLTEEEEGKIVDLEKRLRLYKIIRDATEPFGAAFGKSMIFFAGERTNEDPVFAPDPILTKSALHEALLRVLEAIPKPVFHQEVRVAEVVSIEEMIESLKERIEKAVSFSFKEFSSLPGKDAQEQKVFVIVSFLAMLELVREGLLAVTQEGAFNDIAIERTEPEQQEVAASEETV